MVPCACSVRVTSPDIVALLRTRKAAAAEGSRGMGATNTEASALLSLRRNVHAKSQYDLGSIGEREYLLDLRNDRTSSAEVACAFWPRFFGSLDFRTGLLQLFESQRCCSRSQPPRSSIQEAIASPKRTATSSFSDRRQLPPSSHCTIAARPSPHTLLEQAATVLGAHSSVHRLHAQLASSTAGRRLIYHEWVAAGTDIRSRQYRNL